MISSMPRRHRSIPPPRLQTEIATAQFESKQLEFLGSLLNLLPQEKSFVRTQKAIATEVEALRRKVGRRLRDEQHIWWIPGPTNSI
jgi:hypothetical protein